MSNSQEEVAKTKCPVSLVSTVWNDVEGCRVFFRQMANQTQYPAEIVITDAGSTDGTWEFLQEESAEDRPWKLVLLQEPRCNVARGRNLAIAAAGFEIIASTDIGCEWDPEWLEELVEPLFSKPQVEMVAGSWAVKFEGLRGPWALAEWALKSGKHESVAEAVTFASSRSIAYRKEVWRKIGGYAEDLTLAGDDTVFGHMMNLAGVRASAAPRIRCYWHRHESLKGFLKENRRNFIGDGEAMLSIRHFLLVGGRLVLEWMSALTGVFFILLGMPTGLVIIVFLPFVCSNLLRMKNWIKSSRLLASYGITYAFPRVVFFDTALRIYGLVGFMEGYLGGFTKCSKVRLRLQKLIHEK